MRKLCLFLPIFVSALCAQVAQFPGAIATDSNLKVVANFVQTSTVGSITAADTIVTVRDASRIVANMLLTIDTEVVSVSSKSGNNLTVVRGSDGTTAASHHNGARIYQVPTAWDKNVLSAEIKAIQTALGANLSNVISDAVTPGRYDFAAQSPGGSLVIGANAITMSPVPAGTNGTDTGHYLYISGGTGTAEACLITGGAGVAGDAPGEIIITCANTHTGAFTVQSATDGFQEAVNAATANGTQPATIAVPPGTYNLYAPVRIKGSKTAIVGTGGRGVSRIVQNHATHSVFVFQATSTQSENKLSNLAIVPNFIDTKTGGWAVEAIDQWYFTMTGLQIDTIPSGVLLQDSKSVWFSDSAIRSFANTSGVGIKITGTGTGTDNYYFRDLEILAGGGLVSTAAACINIVTGGGFFFSGITAYDCGTGLFVNPSGAASNEVRWGFVSGGSNFDSNLVNGIRFAPDNAVIKSWSFTDTWVATNAGDGINSTATNGGVIAGLNFDGLRSVNNGFNGATFSTGTTDVRVNGAKVAGNSTNTATVYSGLQFDDGIDNFSVTNSHIGPFDSFTTVQGRGIYVSGTGSDSYTIANNVVTGNTIAIEDQGTGTVRVFENNQVPNADRYATVASGATITLPARNESTIFLTGTTAIQTMSPAWGGRKVRLVFTNASPGGVGTGGTAGKDFGKAMSATQNVPLDCEFAAKWYCK